MTLIFIQLIKFCLFIFNDTNNTNLFFRIFQIFIKNLYIFFLLIKIRLSKTIYYRAVP
jgi:hypothetical protein